MLSKIHLLFLFVILFLSLPGTGLAQDLLPRDPDPERFSAEIEAFRAWDTKNSSPKEAVLFIGSSSFRMWKTAEALPSYPIINRGFGGSHITDLSAYYEDVVTPYNPSVILIYIGDNDIAAGIDGDLFLERYQEFTARIRQDFPEVLIGFVSIKPSSSRWDHWLEMDRVNNVIRETAEEDPQHFYVDLGRLLLKEDGTPDDSLFLSDLLHLNEKGYALWTQELTRLLSEL